MNSLYKYLQEPNHALIVIWSAALLSIFISVFFLPDPPQPYTTSSDVEARRFIARCSGGVLIQEGDDIFTIRCKETQ